MRQGTIVSDQSAIGAFVHNAFGALIGLFNSFDECRTGIQKIVFDRVNDEAVSALLSETILSLDEIAGHHSIEEVYADTIEIERITHDAVHFLVTGSVGVELQWGSNSDVRKGDGAVSNKSFPFRVTMWSPVDDVTCFEDAEYGVDTSSWWEGYHDEGEGRQMGFN